MILILALSSSKYAGKVGLLIEVHPQSAHGVVHAGKNLHRCVARIVAYELFVNFQNPFQFAVENLPVNVGEVEIDHRLAVNAEVVLEDDFEDGAGRHIARHQVAILRIPLFEEVPPVTLRDGVRIALVARGFRHPNASALAARRLRHQPQFIFARDGRRMHLDEFAVGVVSALLIKRCLRRAGADHGVCGFPKNRANAASRDDDCVRRKGPHFHRAQVHGANAATHTPPVEHCRQKFPMLVLLDLALGLIPAHLLIERVKQLLPRGRARECGAVIQRPAKAAEVEQAFRRSIEGNAHAVQQINDARRGLAHVTHRGLVG